MLSFGQDLDAARPRTPLRLFDMAPYAAGVALFSDMIRREFVAPIRVALNQPFDWDPVDPQLTLLN